MSASDVSPEHPVHGSCLCGAVRLGALDDDPGIRPQYHSFVASRGPWETVPDDGLERFDGRKADAG